MTVTSTNNSKVGSNILTASMPVGITCRNDVNCFLNKECYGYRGNLNFANYKQSMIRNLELYLTNPEGYFKCIDTQLTLIPYKYFRWFVTGDIPDEKFFTDIMIKLALVHSNTKFLAFTKKYEIVNEWISQNGNLPENLVIILSSWDFFVPENPHNLPMSYVQFKEKKRNDELPVDAIKCPRKCETCVQGGTGCFNLKNGESVIFKKH